MVIDALQPNNRAFWAILTLVLLIALLVVVRTADWGEESGLGTVPVSVTVLKNGKPASDVVVTLFPMTHHVSLRPAAGTTGANGRCLVTTLRFDDGAMPGPYTVGVEKLPAWSLVRVHDISLLNIDPGAPPSGGGMMSTDPGRMYAVAREQASRPQPGGLPARLISPEKSGLKADVHVDGPNDFTFDIKE